jgi:DNA topoisomerase-2
MSEELLKYKRLTELEHIRARAGIFLGSVFTTTGKSWIPSDSGNMSIEELDFSPGLVKLFDEVVCNCVDEHLRGGVVDSIFVDIHQLTGEIVIRDNGGIPVKLHPEYKIYIPQLIFGELRTGSNFEDDERLTAGQNGYGVKLVNIFSEVFKIETADGVHKYTQMFSDGMSKKTEPTIVKSKERGTTITFTPDYEYFKCKLDDSNMKKLVRRVYDIAGCNPKLKVHLNGQLIKLKSFQEYSSLFPGEYVHDVTEHYEVSVTNSPDESFQHVSFVNGIDVFNGGTHVDYVTNQIVSNIREFIKKKHKIDVKPNVIKQQLFVIMKCVINAPMFNSQSKEFLTTDSRNFGTTYTPSEKFIKKIVTESDVVQKVLDWVEGEKNRAKAADLRKMNKETQASSFLKRIENFDDATSKNRDECTIFFAEGLSAANSLVASRDSKVHGAFPLRGKILNVRDADAAKITANEEIKNIMAIIGLKMGQKVPEKDDGEWYVVEIDGKEYCVNENDVINHKGSHINVSELI